MPSYSMCGEATANILNAIKRLRFQALHRMALDQRGPSGWNHARKGETADGEERTEFVFSALATADHKHYQFTDACGAVGGIHQTFDQKESPARTDRAAYIAEDFGSVLVGPIVNDALQDMGVGAFGDRVEEIASHDLAARGDVARENLGARETT